MTASAPFRSRSWCQMKSASQPSRSLAMWWQSSSQLEPGKTTIPNFISGDHPDVEALDHGVREQLLGHLPRVGLRRLRVSPGNVDEEDLPGAHVPDPAVPEP